MIFIIPAPARKGGLGSREGRRSSVLYVFTPLVQ